MSMFYRGGRPAGSCFKVSSSWETLFHSCNFNNMFILVQIIFPVLWPPAT
jgi:hypothetical protein